MANPVRYPCIRCGQERIVTKTWEESVATLSGVSVVMHTVSVCPDEDCQKIVDESIRLQREKQQELKRGQLKKAEDRKKKAELSRRNKSKPS